MFSTTQISYIELKVQQMFLQGYKHYLIHTNTNFNTTQNREHRDIVLYFSKDEITSSSDYSFRTSSDTIKIEVMSGNPSSQYQYDREVVTSANNQNISIPKYEFVITSISSLHHLDVIAIEKYEYQNSKVFNHEFYLIPIFLSILLLYIWLRNTFPKLFGRGQSI